MTRDELDLGDPYEPPRSSLDHEEPVEPPADVELRVASTGQRLLNLILDSVFMLVGATALFFVVVNVAATVGAGSGAVAFVENVPGAIYGVVLNFLYYVPQEANGGRTLAKRITGTKVVCEDGSPVTVSKVFGRAASRLIPLEAFSFLGKGGQPVGMHDRLPKTRVISTRD